MGCPTWRQGPFLPQAMKCQKEVNRYFLISCEPKIHNSVFQVKGYDFNKGVDYHALLQSYKYSGFQATNFGLAVEEINKMISKRCVLLSRLHSVISCPIQGGADTRGKERVMLQHRARSRGENYNTIHS